MIDPAALARFSERLSYPFADAALLERALTHRSWCAEHGDLASNERIEFLGDAVLGVMVADHAYRSFPLQGEGWLSRARAAVVRTTALAEMAAELGLGEVVQLGKGEDASGGRQKPSILADTLEAVIGAVYLDGGWEPARALVLRLLGARIEALAAGDGDHDDKGRLQELLARRGWALPRYELVGAGPEHDKVFRAVVRVAGAVVGEGSGRSKKQAEQVAARMAWSHLVAALPTAPRTRSPSPSFPSPAAADERGPEPRHPEQAGHDGRAIHTSGTCGENHG